MLAVSDRQGILEAVLIDKIRDQKSFTTLFDSIRQVFQYLAYIGLPVFRLKIDQLADHIQNMLSSFLRRNEFFDLIREENHPDLIIILYSRKGQCGSYLRHDFFLHHIHGTEIAAAGYVNQQHHGQFSLFFKDFYIRTDIARSHIPVYVSNIVPVLVFTYFTESHTTSLEC